MLRRQQDAAARGQLRAQVQAAHAQTVRRHPAAVEAHWWRWFFVQDAGVAAGGCDDPATLLAGQSSAAVPVGLPSPGRGAARGRGGGRRVPERRLPHLVKGSQFLVLEVELDVSRPFTPTPSSPSPRPPPLPFQRLGPIPTLGATSAAAALAVRSPPSPSPAVRGIIGKRI